MKYTENDFSLELYMIIWNMNFKWFRSTCKCSTLHWRHKFSSCGVANNFTAGISQTVWSNLFLLRHTSFLASRTLIASFCYKSAPSPLHMMFKYETSKFSIVHAQVQRSQCRKSGTHGTAKSVSHLCLLLLLEFYVLCTVSYEVDEIDWGLKSSWFF